MKMQAQGVNWAQWVMMVIGVVILIGGFMFVSNVKNTVDNIEIPDAPVVPTAQEIANQIVIPTPVVNRNPNSNLDEILEGVYPAEVRALERECVRDLLDRFENDDVLDDVQDVIEDYEGEEIDDLRITDRNYDDDYDFDVINLGLDDDEDKEAEITSTLRVQYRLEDGNNDLVKDKVYTFARCADYDEEDNEFDDLEVEYSMDDVFT